MSLIPSRHRATLLAATAYLLLVGLQFAPVLRCPTRCTADLERLHGAGLGGLEQSDVRLNTWILAWVQHALLHAPGRLYDANILYPAPNVLTGSEHMLGVALPLLPLRAVTANAVAIYQLAVVSSGFVLALASFALARALTGSALLGFGAGAAALAMPWRQAELCHLQLLCAHWIPLVWLLALRVLAPVEAGRRAAGWLALVLALQLASSYYLAYQTCLALLVLALGVVLRSRVAARSWAALGAAVAVAATLLGALSLPYLRRESQGELFAGFGPPPPALEQLARVSRLLAPRGLLPWSGDASPEPSYALPLAVGLFALVALGAIRREPELPGPPGAVLGLALFAAAAFVLMLGWEVELGGHRLLLPGGLAARWVPGFANVRAPHRWAIGIALAAPILAAVGIARIERLWRVRLGAGRALATLRALLLAGLLLGLPWRSVPATPAWGPLDEMRETYAALEALPWGPVLEIPWPAAPIHRVTTDTRYMLASTLHWRPLLNGSTAYPPPSSSLLHRVAWDLPAAEAVARLARLAGLRWIVVHRGMLSPRALQAWRAAERAGTLRAAHVDAAGIIYGLPDEQRRALDLQALVTSEQRSQSLDGTPRTPLALAELAGALESPRLEEPMDFRGAPVMARRLWLAVRNASPVALPAFDHQDEGTVRLRTVYSDASGAVVKGDLAALSRDVPAGATAELWAPVLPPERDGDYTLCLDLVQIVDGAPRELPLAPAALPVRVQGVGRADPLAELALSRRDRTLREREPERSRCVPAARR